MNISSVNDFPQRVHNKPASEAETRREEIRLVSSTWRREAAARLFAAGLFKQADDLASCSDPERAWQALACPDDQTHFYEPVVPSCKLPYCPMCAHARAAEIASEYAPVVQDALNASPDDYELRHVVLTTPYSIHHSHIDKLTRTIWQKMIYCLETLWGLRQRHWKDFDFGVLGGWEFGEDSHLLHGHLMVLSPWIDIHRLKDCWEESTGGTCQVVYVRRVNGVENGVKEVTKYATKLTAMPPALIPALHRILAQKRRIRAYGAFYAKLEKQVTEPQTCPTCGKLLVLLPLLHLKHGNNFATAPGDNTATTPQTATRPPPIQLELIKPREYGRFAEPF